jgi:hypothetical protein
MNSTMRGSKLANPVLCGLCLWLLAARLLAFDMSDFIPMPVGNPAPEGSMAATNQGVNLAGGGADIGGANDQFYFASVERTGDFDVKARLLSLENTDVWAKAGLMARESLAPGASFAATLASPSLAGCFFQSRTAPGNAIQPKGCYPVNYPDTWLRLQRTGDVFNSYASLDGLTWTLLASGTIAISNRVYLGFAVASHATNRTALARFSELSPVTEPVAGFLPDSVEFIGPSSRKTGLAITEIMYKPAPRADGVNMEFVEIFNSNPFFEDIGGYRLSGDIDFTFPPGTILPGGGFAVVAKTPASLMSELQIPGPLGPFVGTLKQAGTIRLNDRAGAVLLEVPYSNLPPWPVAADGTGNSLVLARPSHGEGNPLAWSASAYKGGSPGTPNAARSGPLQNVMINEILAHPSTNAASTEDFIELYNHSNQELDLSACTLSDDPATNKFIIPPGTRIAARGYLAFPSSQIGFGLSSAGESVFFGNPAQNQVIDAVRFEGQQAGASIGRHPNGAREWYPLVSITPGASNSGVRRRDIIISEIMYNPISGNDEDEYVELFNQGTNKVEVGGWMFTSGITFTLPQGVAIDAGGYLVVAKNSSHLRSVYSHLNAANTVGDYQGKLANGGERLALSMPESVFDPAKNRTSIHSVVVEEVTFETGGRWPRWANGGGASLELKDVRADNRLASNWADSDETTKAPWTTLEATGVLDLGKTTIDSLHVLLLGEGECLLDNVEVFATDNPTNLIANTTFENGLTGWVCQGNHVRSGLEPQEGYESAKSLHIRASGRGDTGANRIRVPLVRSGVLRAGQTATIRAKVRWLRGFPEIVLRLKGNYLEAFGRMALPLALGTPGLPIGTSAAGPALHEVVHSPALPPANQAVVVTAKAEDPDGLASLSLKYRVDPATNYATVAMRDDGEEGDAVAGDGIYSALIPGQAGGRLAAFYVEAADGAAPSVSTRFPASAPAGECLVRFGEPIVNSSFGTYRFWLTASSIQSWTARLNMSNEEVDGTFVYGNQRVVYNAGFRYSGSPWHQGVITSPTGSPVTYAMSVPEGDQVLGTTSFNKIHAPGNTPGDDDTIQREQAAYWMVRQMGLPWNYQRYVNVLLNGAKRGTLMEDTQVPGSDVIDELFPEDADGPLFKLGGWYEFDAATTGSMNFNNQVDWCSLNNYTTTGGVKKTARYRYNWSPRAFKGTANDYSDVFSLIDAFNTPAGGPFQDNVESAADMQQWLRTFAIEHAVGNWDSFGYRNAQNMYAYKPSRDKWKLIIWDFNIVLGNSGSDAGAGNLFSFNYADRGMARIYNNPAFMRAYLRALNEIATGPMSVTNVGPLVDARYASFKANGLSVATPTALKSWISTQQKAIKNYMTNFAVPFALTEATNTTVVADQNAYTVNGVAPLEVKTIAVNGREYPVVWDNVLTWHVRVPLSAATNRLAVQCLDAKGSPIPGASGALTVAYAGIIEPAQSNLVINEIMYRPLTPNAEYVEIRNAASNTVFDLSGCRLAGLDFNFTDGTILEPGGYLVVVKNRNAFLSAYPGVATIAGEYPGRMNPLGEHLRLCRMGSGDTNPEGTTINEVSFSSQSPWPTAANGLGASLQLVESRADNTLPGNWQAIVAEPFPSSRWQFASVKGTATTNSNLLLYHSPFQAVADPMDVAGQWDGTISFPGLEYTMTVEFHRTNANQWAGAFYGEDFTTPLTGIKITGTNVYFVLDNTGGGVRFTGKLSTNGSTLRGTFAQDTAQGTQSLPFSLKRYVDPSIRWGGDCFIDGLSLVAGVAPENGDNLVVNGGFENPLDGAWNIASNHSASVLSSETMLHGGSSLHLVANRGGSALDSAVWQSIQGLVPGQTYTLSYWYLPGTNGTDLTVLMEDSSLASVQSLQPAQIATPGRPNTTLRSYEPPMRITTVHRDADSNLIVEWNGQPGKLFSVLSSDMISGGQWKVVNQPIVYANGAYFISIPSTDAIRFFRIEWMP